jgi:hypothetical protein
MGDVYCQGGDFADAIVWLASVTKLGGNAGCRRDARLFQLVELLRSELLL